MRLFQQVAVPVTTLILVACLASPMTAQHGHGGGRGQPQPEARHAGPKTERREAHSEEERKQQREARALMGLPPRWMERLRDMTPEAQERFLANNERFQNLPPERQAQIRKRLQHWNSLTPEQRQAVRERQHVWEQMSPEQQRYVREEILPKWQQLPPDRRHLLLGHLHALRELNESERAAKLNDPAFLNGLSSDEQLLLRELSKLRVGAASEPPQEN